jgi:acyl carrier protein
MNQSENISAFIHEELLDDQDITVDDDTSLFKGGVLKSIMLLQLIVFLEESFRIKIKPTEVNIKNFDSISSIVRFISKKTSP